MKALLLSILAAALTFHTVAAVPIPPELIGEWATANAKFKGDLLASGSAVYLGANGFAALFGADETDLLGMAGTATYDLKKSVLTLNLHDNGTPPERIKVTISYDSKAKTLTTKKADDVLKESFKRRQDKIPKWVTAESK